MLEARTERVLQESIQILTDQCSLFAKASYEKLSLLTPPTENSGHLVSYSHLSNKSSKNQKGRFPFTEELLSSHLKCLCRRLNCLDSVILPGNALSFPPPFFYTRALNQAMREQLFTLTICKWANKKHVQALTHSLQKAFLPAPLIKLALKALCRGIPADAFPLGTSGCSYAQEQLRYARNRHKRLLGLSKRWEHKLCHYWEKQLVDYIYTQHEKLDNSILDASMPGKAR